MNATNEHDTSLATEVIAGHYASQYQANRIDRHPPTGFSGAAIWRVKALAGNLCLRQWPREHPTPERLRFIHEVLFHAASGGCNHLALPVVNQRGSSFTRHAGHLWELSPWLPGEPKQAESISDDELRAAMAALAAFHRSVTNHPTSGTKSGQTPAIESRLKAIARFDGWADDFHRPAIANDPEFHQAIHDIVYAYRSRRSVMRSDLQAVAADSTYLAPCLRDIWSDHVLFVDGRVSGMIDYGAMAIDTPATDLARLLGSYAGNDAHRWRVGLEGYRQSVDLDPRQQRLVALLDLTSAVLSGMQWIEWLFREQRQFPSPPAVRERVILIASRLERLPARLVDHVAWCG